MSNKKKDFHYGGQAVIEGVMMRGPKDFGVAVRRANGEIVTTSEDVESILGRFKWLDKPFLRGTLALIDAMALGIKALKYSADVAMDDVAEEEHQKKVASGEVSDEAKPEKVNDMKINAVLVLGMLLGLSVFLFVPILIVKPLRETIDVAWQLTLIEGFVKIAIFVGYVAAISLMPDIRRVFQYHGAEHKTINAYEAKEELVVENVRKYTKRHVRCGTSFLLVVLVTNILVLALVADHLPLGSLADSKMLSWFVRFGYKLALLPLVAGISYEVIKFAGKQKTSALTYLMTFPGLLMQKITTREPDDDQIEVAIASLKSVLDKEEHEEDTATEPPSGAEIEVL